MKTSNNHARYEVLINQYLCSILDLSGNFNPSSRVNPSLKKAGLPGKGVLTRLDCCFHVNAYKHLVAKWLPAAVIQPGLKSNPRSCQEALNVFVMLVDQKCCYSHIATKSSKVPVLIEVRHLLIENPGLTSNCYQLLSIFVTITFIFAYFHRFPIS